MGRAALCAGALSLVKKYNAYRSLDMLRHFFVYCRHWLHILLLKQNFILPLYTKFKLLLHFVLLRYLKYFFYQIIDLQYVLMKNVMFIEIQMYYYCYIQFDP